MSIQKFAKLACFGFIFSALAVAQEITPSSAPPMPPPQPGVLKDTLAAPAMTKGEKFGLRVTQQFTLRGLAGSAISAGISQWTNTPAEWGQGAEGYGDRYGSSFGSSLSRQVFAFGLDSALHEDPRYFPSTEKRFFPRLKNVLKQVLITKKDDGGATFAYSRVISAFGAGQLTNTWQPKSNNSVGDGLERGALIMLGDGGYFLLQEFFPFTRSSPFRQHH